MGSPGRGRAPDQRLRVFVSSTLIELRSARAAARRAIEQLHLSPVLLDLAARPHPEREVYAAYLAQSDIFIGIYWQSYGWVGFGADISGVEDELRLSAGMPRLLYVQEPAPDRDPRLEAVLEEVRQQGADSYKIFNDAEQLEALVLDDLALLLTERFEAQTSAGPTSGDAGARSVVLQPLNVLIGRETELAHARALLAADDIRLITLTGPGGVGKSRLALELARLVEPEFPDGVWTVLLEAISDPTLVLTTVARTLKLRTGGSDDPDEVLGSLRRHLDGRRVLLVLDNFEHVLAAAADLARLIESCDGLHVLVTSRSALRVRAEHEVAVLPLEVAEDPESASIAQLEQAAAVQLFVARARAANRDLGDDEKTLRTVAEICRRLDGLPLAIELAAARVRLLPPHQLLRRLEQRFSMLTAGTSDMPERHQTLRATIDWGYDLLDAGEKTALRRLAVFSGGWTLAAAESVLTAAGPLEADVLDALEGLVTKSFVTVRTGLAPAPRFGMLETVKEYAAERLRADADLEPCVDAHAEYFLAFAEHAAPHLQGPDQTTWIEALEDDHDNLLAALRRLEERGDVERELCLTVALGRLWFVHSHLAQARRWLTRALEHSAGRRDAVRAEVLTWAGWLALFVRGDVDAAQKISEEALEIRRHLGDAHGEAMELLALGNIAVFRGDASAARRWYRETIELTQANDDDEVQGRALLNLGVVARSLGELEEAREAAFSGRRIMQERGDDHSVALANSNLSGIMLDRGELDEAAGLARETVRQSQGVADEFTLLEALENLSAVWGEQGRTAAAGWLYGAADAMARSLSMVRNGLEGPLYERYLTRTRARAAAAGHDGLFTSAWNAGATASRAAVIAVALGEQPVPGEQ